MKNCFFIEDNADRGLAYPHWRLAELGWRAQKGWKGCKGVYSYSSGVEGFRGYHTFSAFSGYFWHIEKKKRARMRVHSVDLTENIAELLEAGVSVTVIQGPFSSEKEATCALDDYWDFVMESRS